MTRKISQLAQALLSANPQTIDELSVVKRRLAKEFKTGLPTNSLIITELKKITPAPTQLIHLLKRRIVRTQSGIAPIAVLTKPWPCPGRCAYCPTVKDVPQSYLANEPAVMRAIHCHFEPYEQVQHRLTALEANGHEPTKIELIVIGGTWSSLQNNYQYWYILNCFKAANEFANLTKGKPYPQTSLIKLKQQLALEQKKNETAKYKIIGVTLETRPDYINEQELWQMRELGATRVELGVQALDDKILKLNRRDSTVADIVVASKLLKDFGFKTTYHFMPALPGSTPAHDLEMFQDMFSLDNATKTIQLKTANQSALKNIIATKLPNNNFNPDQLKFYPTVVTKGSLLYRWWKQGKYKPYTDAELQKLIIDCKKIIPPFVRIIRLIRDIPGESIEAGNKITNLRQLMQNQGAACRCIRCREIGQATFTLKDAKLFITKYRASDADEYFISFASADQSQLYGFARLRLSPNSPFKNTALLRELHVYGELVSVGKKTKQVQHQGLGKQLIAVAENITRLAGFKQLAVISGVGVRGYYRKLNYSLHKTYLIKKLDPNK